MHLPRSRCERREVVGATGGGRFHPRESIAAAADVPGFALGERAPAVFNHDLRDCGKREAAKDVATVNAGSVVATSPDDQ